MKIAFYKGLKSNNLLDKLICIFTMSKYSHCELIDDQSGLSYSASIRDKGVREKIINYENDIKWDVFDLNLGIVEDEYIKLNNFFLKTDYMGYSILSLISAGLFTYDTKTYCSKWCLNAIEYIKGYKLFMPEMPPGEFYNLLKNAEMIKNK